jgi:AcrR family transcriptional regulator
MTNPRQAGRLGRLVATRPDDDMDHAPRPRGRPRSAETDEAILGAAWDILAEGRYDRLTFEAVADRAGCSRPTLYRRFRNRVELVRAMVDPFRQSMTPQVRDDADARVALLEYLQSWVDYLGSGGGEVIMALWQARREDPEMSAMLDDIYARGRGPHIALLRRFCTPGVADTALVVLVDAMLGGILFRCVHCQGSISRDELQLLADQAIAAASRLAA